jgi:predicted dehydrogenase
MPRPRRAAAIGVGHWHAVDLYLRPLENQGVKLVGVSDPDQAIAEDRARLFQSAAYVDYRRMIETTRPDFVVALGKHVDMPETFRYLVEAGIPFLMEKPWGVDAATVQSLADLAESKKGLGLGAVSHAIQLVGRSCAPSSSGRRAGRHFACQLPLSPTWRQPLHGER